MIFFILFHLNSYHDTNKCPHKTRENRNERSIDQLKNIPSIRFLLLIVFYLNISQKTIRQKIKV